jgi:hypothetical protein
MKNNYAPEILDTLIALVSAGFTLRAVDNGGGKETAETPATACSLIDATDESYLYVTAPDGKRLSLFFVLGNSPGELVADWTMHPALDAVLDAVSDRWMGTEQIVTA